MPEPMTEGMNLDPTTLIAVQNERIAAAAIREAQLTAAVQQLTMENIRVVEEAKALRAQLTPDAPLAGLPEDEDASPDIGS